MKWYTQRPVPGVSLPAIMVDMAPASASPQPTPMDLAPGPVMQQADASPPEPAIAGSRAGANRTDPAAGEARSRGAAGAEARADAAKPEPAKIVPEKAGAGETEAGSQGRQEADGGPACAAHDGGAAGRTPGAGGVRASAGASAAAVASYNQMVAAICSASSNIRRLQRPPASRARRAEFQPQPRRPGAVEPARGIVRPRGARCRDAGDGPPRTAVSALSRRI